MYDSNLLKPANQHPETGLEVAINNKKNIFGITLLQDNFGTIRAITECGNCGMMLESDSRSSYLIKGIFTKETFRQKGLAKQLIAAVEYILGKQLHTGGMVTELGKHLNK